MKKASRIITIIVIAAVIVGIGVASYMSSKVKYNDDSYLGNTSGNLMNKGLFAEHNGKIYFSNPYDGDKLYSMNSDCTNIKKLSDDSVSYINVTDNYIFYVRNNFDKDNAGMIFRGQLYGVIRSKLNGKNAKALTVDVISTMALIGNRVYYGSYDNGKIQTMYTTIDRLTIFIVICVCPFSFRIRITLFNVLSSSLKHPVCAFVALLINSIMAASSTS